MRIPPAASYTLRRLGLFLATLALGAALLRGLPFFVVLVIATFVSSVLSYFLLAGPREAMARSVSGRVGALNARIDASAAAEDEAIDAAERARQAAPGPTGENRPQA
ncbi:MAG: DUF4229 domain-containing protein [Sporichthyaceae bacterium]